MSIEDALAAFDNQAREMGGLVGDVLIRQEDARLPQVQLPGGAMTVRQASAELGPLVARGLRVFNRGGALVRAERDEDGYPVLAPLPTAALVSEFERVAMLVKLDQVRGGGEPALVPAVCSEQQAKVISSASEFVEALPVISAVSRCPVLVLGKDGGLSEVTGYDAESGILASGGPVPRMPLDEAVNLITDALSDFAFATEGDRARAMAALVTPALLPGGLLGGRAPIDLGEADEPQAGKGYRAKLTASVYNTRLATVTERRGGVGSMDESFGRALISGAGFICLDNLRGRVDSQALESFMTEDQYIARALRTDMIVDPRKVTVMMTSNKAELTSDLARRSSTVRIRRRGGGYEYRTYPEGDIIDHVRANQPLYLGAVFAVARAWHEAGRPQTSETRHDFRRWARSLDWIVRNLFHTCPLMEGHQQAQARMANPALTWLRDLANAVLRQKRDGVWLKTHALADIAENDGGVEIPGLAEGRDPGSESTHKAVLQAFGRRLKQCFRDGGEVVLDDVSVSRREVEEQRPGYGGGTYPAPQYMFERRPGTDGALSRAEPRTDEVATPTDAADSSGIPICSNTTTCVTGIKEPSVRQCGQCGEPAAPPFTPTAELLRQLREGRTVPAGIPRPGPGPHVDTTEDTLGADRVSAGGEQN